MKKRAKKRSKTFRSKSGNVYKLTLVKKGKKKRATKKRRSTKRRPAKRRKRRASFHF